MTRRRGIDSTPRNVFALCRELAHELIYEPQRYFPHLRLLQITDRMRQLDIRVPVHAFGAKLEYGRILECLRDDSRRGNAAFFEFYGVVHTAQRA